jgi:dienelactone hydrolase
MKPLSAALGLFMSASLSAQEIKGWPAEVREIKVRSTLDQSEQPALAWSPAQSGARPLLVGLHTWGGDYKQSSNGPVFLRWAMRQGWHFVAPHFRGPNRTPAALGSDLAVRDIVDAVEHMKRTVAVDPDRVYLIGASGGGHMALLMAGRHPDIWAGVSSWVPISDVAAWHREHLKNGRPDGYARDIELALGGAPDTPELLADARHRSPLTWLAAARAVPLDINHGIHDGRQGSVPFRHSLHAFNVLAGEGQWLPEQEIAAFYETQQLPQAWAVPEEDALYGSHHVRFRAISGNTRVTVFEGGHEILYYPSLNWLAAQRRSQPAVWKVLNPVPIGSADTQSGK